MFNITRIVPDTADHDITDQLQMEGTILPIDTRTIMNNVDLESLTSDEIIEVRSNLGQYQAYV
jgi:hypothetical protein